MMSNKQSKAVKLEAFNAVVREYEAALLRYATRITGNDNLAQDIVQDAFLKLLRSWKDDMTPSPNMSSWLYRVAHNRSIDYIRRAKRRRQLHQKHAEEQDDYTLPNRGEGFQISEAAAAADVALQSISLRERELVVLKVYEEKSYKEISEITGLTVSNVGYILHHAMKKLAKHLRKAEDS